MPDQGVAQGQGSPALPFRATRDGKVNFKDLLELTKQAPKRDRISDEELEAIKKEHPLEYGRGFRATGEPKMPPRNDLYKNSVIISDGVNHTLLPKKAVLFVPEALEERVAAEPTGELILWPNFLRRHRKWLRPQEVTFETAKGEKPLPPERIKSFESGGAIVVAVLRGNPISVLPPKTPAPETLSPTDTGTSSAGSAQRFTRKEAAQSLARVQDEAEAMADENAAATGGSSGSSAKRTVGSSSATNRQRDALKKRAASRFNRFKR